MSSEGEIPSEQGSNREKDSSILDQIRDAPVGYKSPPRDGQWKPGQSGNPGGRPKWKPMSEALASRISEEGIAQALADKLIVKAGNGDVGAWREIADRLEGKVAQTIGGSTDLSPMKITFGWERD